MPSEVINLAKGRAFDLSFPNSPRKRKVEEGNGAEQISESWHDPWASS
jgi:hypothetical protein